MAKNKIIKEIKPDEILNEEKQRVLKKYKRSFENYDLDDLNVLPILMSRDEVMRTIEIIYDKLVRKIVNSKSSRAINLSHTMYNFFLKQSKGNKTYLIQSIADLLYSADKYSEFKEVLYFLVFINGKIGDLQLLFYLYLRQHVKIVNNINFMHLHKTKKTPLSILMKFLDGKLIFQYAFFFDEINMNKFLVKYN